MKPEALSKSLEPYLDSHFVFNTRIHKSNRFFGDQQVWIKREDELSGGIMGSKYRKYAGLIPYFLEGGYDALWITGSDQSNNVLGLLQMANEFQIPYRLFLLKGNDQSLVGNRLWISLLANPEQIRWLSRSEWANRQAIINSEKANNPNISPLIIPEGAGLPAALPGSLTLGIEVAAYENAHNMYFDHIFVDSGTGLTAIGLILALGCMGKTGKTVHVTLLAGDQAFFEEELVYYQSQLKAFINGEEAVLELPEIAIFPSRIAPSFGSVNTNCREAIREFAKSEGILTDPVYGIKHAYTCREQLKHQALEGDKLFIHNGGAMGLSGYQAQMAKLA